MSVGRKVFHCVVDDTALTANVGEIKKWTSQGAITLIVPLYTLERLRHLKKAGSKVGANAREAVRFLDRVTSGKHNISAEKIVLQGPMEQFENWKEAERYFLPEFKEVTDTQNGSTDVSPSKDDEEQAAESVTETSGEGRSLNEMSQMLLSKLNFKKDPDSVSVASAGTCSLPPSPTSGGSRASPECSSRQLENGKANKVKLDKAVADDNENSTKYVVPTVPAAIKPLLNSTLWRLHSLSEAPAAANGCILVTNDRLTQAWAQKFGITVKTIPQLRTSIIYEEKEFKNHCKYMEKNQTQSQSVEPKPLLSYEDESDEDVLVFVPRKQGKAGAQGGTTPTRPAAKDTTTPANRAASGAMNSNGKSSAKHVSPEPSLEVPSAPIDPDSFSRTTGATKQHPPIDPIPTGAANRGMGGPAPRGNGNRRGGGPRGGMIRGAGRGRGRLWVP